MYPPYDPYPKDKPKDKPMPATNPNNCSTCSYKENPQGGWCYMFRDEPITVCMIHSARHNKSDVIGLASALRAFKRDDTEKGGM